MRAAPRRTRLSAPRITRAARLVVVNSLAMAYWVPKTLRNDLLRRVGYDIGRATIFSGSILRCDELRVGDGAFINHRCLFDRGRITIDDNVYISSGVSLLTGNHEMGDATQRAAADFELPIHIGRGSWLGANVVVLSGVSIAPGCVVGAGAVVIDDTEPNGVYVGVPARRVRSLTVAAPLVEGAARG